MMYSAKITLIAFAVAAVALVSCAKVEPEGAPAVETEGAGFVIKLVQSGEVVFQDWHVESYDWDTHRIKLTPRGTERWNSFGGYAKRQHPPSRMIGSETNREFAVMVDGVEMYRGHFWSMLLSQLGRGVTIYDTLGATGDEIHLGFHQVSGDSMVDPRDHPEVAAHFRRGGRLREVD